MKCPNCRSALYPGETKRGTDGHMWQSRPFGQTYRWYRKSTHTSSLGATKKKSSPYHPRPRTRYRNKNYSYQQQKLTKMSEKGMTWEALYEKTYEMQKKGKLPQGLAARVRAIKKATKNRRLRPPLYENKHLRSRPRRLTADTEPTRMGLLPDATRERIYRDAVQICHYEKDKGVTTKYIQSEIQDEDNQVFLTRNVDGTIVSFLIVEEEYKDPMHPNTKVAEVQLICAQRGGGLKLLEQAKRYYTSKGYDLIRLEAVSTAVAAYKRSGFKEIEHRDSLTIMVYSLSNQPRRKIKGY